ncbi:CoA-binding protein [Kiritimatiellaeota bacterium B1221]|nr:CoA-binding protein [Kiritimatiellaeota bacterium B1221]
MTTSKRTVVLGASPKSERISNQAVADLKAAGHAVIPVNPVAETIHGLPVSASISDISGTVDTLTMYVNASRSSAMQAEILALNPRRVLFNPGSENPDLQKVLVAAGIEVENACTLILLRTGQY